MAINKRLIAEGKPTLNSNTLLTSAQVDAELNPSGQLTDYNTQRQIRYNTYSGIDLTGISAAFGKTLGYVFEAGAIASVIDVNTKEVIDLNKEEDVKAFLKKYGQYSIEAVLKNNKNFKIVSRKEPEFTSANHFTVDKEPYTGLSRNTKGKFKNIFETIDSIINLAIDNVKEGKLHLMGITGSNANIFFSLLATGMPLNTVTLIMKNPLIVELSTNGKKIDNAAIDVKIGELKKSLEELKGEEYVNMLSKSKDIDTKLLEQIYLGELTGALAIEETLKSLQVLRSMAEVGKYMFKASKVFKALIKLPNKKFEIDDTVNNIESLGMFKDAAASEAEVNSEWIDIAAEFARTSNDPDIARVQAQQDQELALSLEELEVKSSANLKREDLKTNAQEKVSELSKTIKELKSRKTKINKILAGDNILSEEEKAILVEELDKNELEVIRLDSIRADLNNGLTKVSNYIAKLVQTPEGSIFGTEKAAIRAAYVNSVLRKTVTRGVEGRSDSPFTTDTTILRIPHVASVYKVLLTTQGLLNKTFAVYNPTITSFIKNIVDNYNIFKQEDSTENVEIITKEFVKFVGSNLTFKLDGADFSTEVPYSEYPFVSSRNKQYWGKEAWAQRFLEKARLLDDSNEMTENNFVKNLELSNNTKTGLTEARILADKVKDDEVLARIRRDFAALAVDETEIAEGYTRADFARDMFKYSLLSSTMYYERTGFAQVFPEHWAVAYSKSLSSRLNAVLPKDSAATDIHLEMLKDTFITQLMTNNSSMLNFLKAKPEVVASKKVNGKKETLYEGYDELNNVHYHLKFKGSPYEDGKSSEFVSHYDKAVYRVIKTPGSVDTFYVRVAMAPNSKFYNFTFNNLGGSVQHREITSGKYYVTHLDNAKGNVLKAQPLTTNFLPVGTEVLAYDQMNVGTDTATVYTVTKVNVENGSYTLKKSRTIDLKDYTQGDRLRAFYAKFSPRKTTSTIAVDDIKRTMANLKNASNTVFLTNSRENVSGTLTLNIPDISPNTTQEELAVIVEDIQKDIEALPNNKNYYVSSKLLEQFNDFSSKKAILLAALFRQIGYKENNAPVSQTKEGLSESMKRITLGILTLPQYKLQKAGNDVAYTHSVKKDRAFRNVAVGDILWAVKDIYMHVTAVTENEVHMREFKSAVFMSIEKENISSDEFETIYNKHNNC
jgi:hypothetical protein